MKGFPHAIFYDFESYGDSNQRKEPTPTLTIENAHVPISVSVGDILEREPSHICERDPSELASKFMEELERHGKNIRARVRAEIVPEDVEPLQKAQRPKIEEWANQVPVVGFNSGRYDLNLIKNHLAERLADTTKRVRVAKNGNKTMFMLTWGFRFLDIINYLGPGTSYAKWVKAYDCETVTGSRMNGLTTPKSLISLGSQSMRSGIRGSRVNTFSRGKNGRRVSGCSKKGGCAPSQTGFGTTTIWMWHLA